MTYANWENEFHVLFCWLIGHILIIPLFEFNTPGTAGQ